MEISTQFAKKELRAKVQAHLRLLALPEREAAAAQAGALLRDQPVWRQARSVLLFAPLPDELDVWPLLAAALSGRKTVALPRFDPETNGYVACQVQNLVSDVKIGHFGIREPGGHCPQIALNRLDFILVPGVAFDLQGRRLGRGKGFFDRLLAAARGTTCGVAFDEQIVREIPVAPHDVRVNRILTPTRWIEP
jgi:5-formyltetrahydrofolate cyclo-ligase